ncbi:hypothetical protein HY643_02550 [Candidatus Woesearchaeota archaeon]|nr:hypothetical protein [Candidatus Woesearchaeota archaeon]
MKEVEIHVPKDQYTQTLDILIDSLDKFKILPNHGFKLEPATHVLDALDWNRIDYKPSRFEIELFTGTDYGTPII